MPNDMRSCRTLFLLLMALSFTACHRGQASGDAQRDARSCFELGLAALDSDSVRTGELLLNDAIRLAQKEEDWHTMYLA